jgi:hypothetical protein
MTRCPNGSRRNKKTGNCESSKTKKNRCPNGTRRNKKTGNCESKTNTKKNTKKNKSVEKYAHHVKCTIRYYGDFKSKAQLSNWFKNGDSYSYIHPDEDDDDVFNFKYKAEILKKRYGAVSNEITIEFDTNKSEEYILDNILGSIELNDADGNHPINGKLVTGEIIDDDLYISNTEQYS